MFSVSVCHGTWTITTGCSLPEPTTVDSFVPTTHVITTDIPTTAVNEHTSVHRQTTVFPQTTTTLLATDIPSRTTDSAVNTILPVSTNSMTSEMAEGTTQTFATSATSGVSRTTFIDAISSSSQTLHTVETSTEEEDETSSVFTTHPESTVTERTECCKTTRQCKNMLYSAACDLVSNTFQDKLSILSYSSLDLHGSYFDCRCRIYNRCSHSVFIIRRQVTRFQI